MLRSMTGYASKTSQLDLSAFGQVGISVEIKTLNSRFFEVVSKLPSTLSHLELPITTTLQELLQRGRVYLNLKLEDSSSKLKTVAPAWSVLDQYYSAAQEIKKKYNLADDVSLQMLLARPDIFVEQDVTITADDEQKIIDLVKSVAERVAQMRIEEGKRLQRDFISIFTICAQKHAHITASFQQEVARQKDLLKEALESAPSLDAPNPAVDEIQSVLRKIDIHEEITRFKSHLDGVIPYIDGPSTEKGKRIDFMLQELLRETNTMMAKCPSAEVTTACIDIKVELEKAREQVQNIV